MNINVKNEEYRPYVEFEVKRIKDLTGSELTNHLIDFFRGMGDATNVSLSEDDTLDLRDANTKIELLEEIYNNIQDEMDKNEFIKELMDSRSYLGDEIVNYFGENYVQVPEELEEQPDEEEPEEELEETVEEPEQTYDGDYSLPTETEEPEEELEENLEEQPEELEQSSEEVEETIEQPEPVVEQRTKSSSRRIIDRYKEETRRMEQELEALIASMNTPTPIEEEIPTIPTETPEEKKPDALEIIEPSDDLRRVIDVALSTSSYDKTIEEKEQELEDLNEEIRRDKEDIERYIAEGKPHNIRDHRVKQLETRKEALEKEINALKYKKSISEKSTEYVNAQAIRDVIIHEIEYTNQTISALNKLKEELHNNREYINTEIYAFEDKLNAIIENLSAAHRILMGKTGDIRITDPENAIVFKTLKDSIENNNNIRKQINENVYQISPEIPEVPEVIEEPEPTPSIDPELEARIEALKSEIAKRKENERLYDEAYEIIKNIRKQIKEGKTPEELKNEIDEVNKRIDLITDEQLKDSLKDALKRALRTKTPEKISDKIVIKQNKWAKWIAGLAGLGVGIGLSFAVGGGVVIAAATGLKIATNFTRKLIKKHEDKKALESKVSKENEITSIEPANEKQKGIIDKFKKFMLNEEYMRNVNWFLNGAIIGGVGVSIGTHIHNSIQPNYYNQGTQPTPPSTTQTQNISGTPAPTPSQPNLSVGDSASGLDLTQGFTNSNNAISGTNPVSLNQGIMNDGNSVIRRIMDASGNTYSSIAEATKAGVPLDQLSLDIAKDTAMTDAVSRAWTNAETATRGLR